MRVIRDKVEGDLTVESDTTLQGMVAGNAYVNAPFELNGMCCRDVVVNEGGDVALRGMVVGNVINRGGVVRIWGMVIGQVMDEAGTTFIEPGAVVGGRKH